MTDQISVAEALDEASNELEDILALGADLCGGGTILLLEWRGGSVRLVKPDPMSGKLRREPLSRCVSPLFEAEQVSVSGEVELESVGHEVLTRWLYARRCGDGAFALAALYEERSARSERLGEQLGKLARLAGRQVKLRVALGREKRKLEDKWLVEQTSEAQRIAQFGCWRLDVQRNELWWSDEVFRIFGVDPEGFEATFEAFLSFVHPEDRDSRVAEHEKALRGSHTLRHEHRIVRPDGSVRHVSEHGELLLDEGGGTTHFTGVVIDVTRRKQAELALRENGMRFQQFFEHAADLVFVHRDNRIEYMNMAGARLLKADDPSDLIGRSPFEFIHSDDHAVARERIGRLMEKPGEIPVVVLRCVCCDGEVRELETFASSFHVGDEKLSIQVVCRDVTGRRKSEKRMRFLETCIERMNDIVLVTEATPLDDPGPRITFVNDAFARMTGYSKEEAIGQTPRFLQGPLTDRRELARIRAALEAGEAVRSEVVNYSKDGELYWLELDVAPLREEDGTLTHFLAVQRDVTERRRAQEALIEGEAELTSLMNNLPGLVYSFDEEGRMLRWNRELERVLGYGSNEIPKKSVTDFIAASDRELLAERLAELFENGSAEERLKLVAKDGRELPYLFRAGLLSDGDEPKVLGVALDISEQLKAESQLRRQAALLDQTRDAIYVVGETGRILYWNQGATRLYGWSEEEALALSSVEALFANADEFREIQEVTRAKRLWSGALEHRDRQNKPLQIEARWSAIDQGSGADFNGILAVNTDVSEKRFLEAQFLRAQRMEAIGTLAGGIAHDLNNILSPILLSIDLLRERHSDQGTQRTLATIGKAAERGAGVIKQILTFARGLDGQAVAMSPAPIVNEIASLLRETFPRAIEVSVFVERNIGTLKIDPTQLHQALLNLCVNARDAMPHGGKLSINARNVPAESEATEQSGMPSRGRRICIEVVDTGIGMDESVQAQLFDPFFTTKGREEGTGLGLATVQGIVRAHGGFLEVESKVNQGSRFSLYFPVENELATKGDWPKADVASNKGDGETVLFVDDEEAIRAIAGNMLEENGYKVLLSENGAKGLATYHKHRDRIGILVTDIMMPVMDGTALIKGVRRADPSLPVIVTSGVTGETSKAREAEREGAVLIEKPYATETLLNAIRSKLEALR